MIKKLILSILVVFSVFSFAGFAETSGFCDNQGTYATFKCVGGLGDNQPCATSVDCNLAPALPPAYTLKSTSLAADITLGVMGVAVAALVTLVGFTLYAKNAPKAKPAKRKRR